MAAFASEWIKVRHRRLTWVLLALVPAVISVLYAMLFASMASADQSPEDAAVWDARLSLSNLVTFGDAMVYRLVALFCVILAGSMTANEFGWRTILTITTWTGDRRSVLAGKLGVTAVVGFVFILAGWAAAASGVVVGNAAQGTLEADAITAGLGLEVVRGIAVTWGAAMIYAVIAAALGIWTRSAAAAIAVPLGILVLEPLGAAALVALGGIAELAASLTLSYNIDALLAANGAIDGTPEDLSGYPAPWRGGLFLALFGVVTVFLTLRTLLRRDIRE